MCSLFDNGAASITDDW